MDKKTAWYNIGKLSSLISEHSRHHEVMAQGQIMDVGLLIDIQKINLKIKEKDVDCFSGCVKTKYF